MPTKILIVEDMPTNLKLLNMILTKAGYECQTSSNGKDALKLTRAMSFDIILTDLKMSGLDGSKLIPALKNEDRLKHIPIIVLSSSSLEEFNLTKENVAAYLTKPIQPGILLETIGNFLPEKVDPDYAQRVKAKEQLEHVEKRKAKREITEIQIIDGFPVEALPVNELQAGMIVGDEVLDENNISLMPMGLELTDKLIKKLCSLNIDNILIRK